MLPEKFYQYLWQHRLFYPSGITTTEGETVEIINPGCLNTDAGPDFFNAQVRIGDTHWAGNVEIHCTTDGWIAHRHDTDAAYDNVILHVVGESTNAIAYTSKGRRVPEIVIKYPQSIAQRYEQFEAKNDYIRCAEGISNISSLIRDSWLDRLLFERFEQRNIRVEKYLDDFNGDWDQTFFCLLARAMGFVVNAEPMEQLARRTPIKIFIKHNNPIQIEALLIGQAGLLPSIPSDEYSSLLIREYNILKAKFDLKPMDGSVWKQLRMRPQNFPLIRLSQLASILLANPGNFESVFRSLNIKSMLEKLEVETSQYWNTHYQFGKESEVKSTKKLGLQSRRLVIINAVVPFIFAYARRYGDEREQLNIVRLLQFLPIEHNSRLDKWISIGLQPQNEGEAQALLLLYKNYCLQNRCLSCRFCHEILKSI